MPLDYERQETNRPSRYKVWHRPLLLVAVWLSHATLGIILDRRGGYSDTLSMLAFPVPLAVYSLSRTAFAAVSELRVFWSPLPYVVFSLPVAGIVVLVVEVCHRGWERRNGRSKVSSNAA